MSLDSPDPGASRLAIRDELIGRLVYDDARVFQRLALERVSSEFVACYAQEFNTDTKLLAAKRELDSIVAAAIEKSIEELEADHEVEDSSGTKTFKKNMYGPLMTIFQHVENFPDSSSILPKRSFESTDFVEFKSNSSTWGFPKASPDFSILDCLSPTPISSGRKRSVFWHQRSGFCEVKPTPQQGPRSEDPKVVKPIVSQAADYARLHLSARPFQLFSIGLLIFGSEFCVVIFDRGGVQFSPIHNMWADADIFIRVVRSLTFRLSSVELGQDPTIAPLPVEQHQLWRAHASRLGYEVPEDFPTFVITMWGPDSPRWYTIGLSIWTSVSLLGRGTAVWSVHDKNTDKVFVLKNTWRSAARLSESTIYGAIDGHHPAVAKLHLGGDVLFPGEQRHITVGNLRGPPSDNSIGGGDVFLHRLLLATHGRPLWQYRSDKELLQAIRAALNAHQFLCDQGILHRDISADNIMLSAETTPNLGAEGFLMDLEFARIKRPSLNTTTQIAVPSIRAPSGTVTPTVRTHSTFGPDIMCDAAMAGTAQFMAEEILAAIVEQQPIQHEPRHDIESFIYVLCYTVSRKLVLESCQFDDDTREDFHSYFHATFGRMDITDIYLSRPKAPVSLPFLYPQLLSQPMAELISTFEMVLRQGLGLLNHTFVLSKLDEAIENLA